MLPPSSSPSRERATRQLSRSGDIWYIIIVSRSRAMNNNSARSYYGLESRFGCAPWNVNPLFFPVLNAPSSRDSSDADTVDSEGKVGGARRAFRREVLARREFLFARLLDCYTSDPNQRVRLLAARDRSSDLVVIPPGAGEVNRFLWPAANQPSGSGQIWTEQSSRMQRFVYASVTVSHACSTRKTGNTPQ